jgi:hypothetical protein
MTSVFDLLTIKDSKILKELDNAEGDHQKVMDILARRIALYGKAASKIDDPITRAIVNTRKSLIISDIGLLSTQQIFRTDITKIMSRLDQLEEKVSRIADRKSA